MKITIPYHLSIKYMSLHHGHKTYLLAKQQLNILPNIISFFIPTSKHLRRRQWGQKRRVRTSIRQSFWKRHFGCWKKMHIIFNVEISIVQIVNTLSPCKFYSQLKKNPSNLEEICYPWYFKSEQSFYFALYNIQMLMLLQNFVEEKKNLTSYIYNHWD